MADRTHRTNYDIAATDLASPAFQKVQRAMQGLQVTGLALRNVLGTIGIGFAPVAFAASVVKEAKEAEQASARLTSVLKATGAAAGTSTDQIDEMADALSRATQFDDDAFRNAASSLLKFGNIQGDVFKQGLKLSADLAAFMGTDVPEAAQLIGKSLQSPTEGLTMMERQFGKLTDAEEKHIASLVNQGKAVEAQNAVLDIWRSKIGGTAEAMNTGLTKATSDLSKSWDDMLKAIGRTETVGSIVQSILGGLARTLRDIEAVVKPNPFKQFELDLKLVNDELERIQRSRPGSKRSALVDEQIERLKNERDLLQQTLDAMRNTQPDPFAFDPKSLDIELGGKKKDWREENKEWLADQERISRALVEGQEEEAQVKHDASEAQKNIDVENARIRQKALEDTTAAFVESAQLEQDRIDGLVFSYDKFGNQVVLLKEDFEELEAQQNRGLNIGRELGLTFTSAFEDAVIAGKALSEVIKGIGQDIERIILRKLVTEPFAEAIAQGVKGFSFGGGSGPEQLSGPLPQRAGGGPVTGGRPYIVGEEGPELFVPGMSGGIMPNGWSGGGTYYIDARGADREGLERLEGMIRSVNGSIERRAVQAQREASRR